MSTEANNGAGQRQGLGQGRAGAGQGQGRAGTIQDPYHSVRQGVFLVQQDSDEEAVGARVCHVSNAQQGRS